MGWEQTLWRCLRKKKKQLRKKSRFSMPLCAVTNILLCCQSTVTALTLSVVALLASWWRSAQTCCRAVSSRQGKMDSVKVKIMETRGRRRKVARGEAEYPPAALDMGCCVIKMASEGGGP